MDVAVESPANTQPPPLLFGAPGGESPNNVTANPPAAPQSAAEPLSPSTQPSPPSVEINRSVSDQPTIDPSPDVQMADAQEIQPDFEAAQNEDTPETTAAPLSTASAEGPMDTSPDTTEPSNPPEPQNAAQNGNDSSATVPASAEAAEESNANATDNNAEPQTTENQQEPPSEAQSTDPTNAPANGDEAEMTNPPSQSVVDPVGDAPGEDQTNPEPSAETPAEPEEPAPWADMPDDTSVPDEEEMKEIEESGSHSAADHAYWEELFYNDMEDPDHIPIEKTRITWIIQGVRGTKEKPQRDLILKSPKALVGGHYWGFKFFPRGNNNDDLSIYIDCSNEPEKCPTDAVKTLQFRCLKGPADADLSKMEPSVNILAPKEEPAPAGSASETKGESSKENETSDPNVKEETTDATETEKAENTTANSQESSSEETQAEQVPVKESTEWRVSAQIGLVCYNPNEPRTRYNQSSYHMFTGENCDWGWTRFHGPWKHIQQRKRGQVKPLMQNDTLAMDAYIRIIKDDTKSLWWHSSDGEPYWPAMTLHGLRGLGSADNGSVPLSAAIVPWVFLAPFRRIMYNVKMPEGSVHDEVAKPLSGAFQKIIYLLRAQEKPCHFVDIGKHGLFRAMRDYSEGFPDVVSSWESLRRMIEIELKGTDAIGALADIFDGRLDGDRLAFEREHTLRINRNWISVGKEPTLRVPVEGVKDIQEALEKAFAEKSGPWALPKLLQVELDRQKFDKDTRKWQKIMDKVALNEEADLSKWTRNPEQGKYVLYGFVVHQGERTSWRFFTVLRPAGPGGKWFSFKETSETKIACLTKKEVTNLSLGPGPESVRATKPPGDVPYIALYVRKDVVSEFLKPELEPWEPPRLLKNSVVSSLPKGTAVEEDTEVISRITCELYNSDIFKGRIGRGVLDIWDPDLKAKFPGKIITFEFPSEMKLSFVRWKIYKLLSLENEEQVRIWLMVQPPPAPYWKDYGIPVSWGYLDTPLSYYRSTKLRIWFHILPKEDFPVLGVSSPPIPVPPPEPEQEDAQREPGDAEAAPPSHPEEGSSNPSEDATAVNESPSETDNATHETPQNGTVSEGGDQTQNEIIGTAPVASTAAMPPQDAGEGDRQLQQMIDTLVGDVADLAPPEEPSELEAVSAAEAAPQSTSSPEETVGSTEPVATGPVSSSAEEPMTDAPAVASEQAEDQAMSADSPVIDASESVAVQNQAMNPTGDEPAPSQAVSDADSTAQPMQPATDSETRPSDAPVEHAPESAESLVATEETHVADAMALDPQAAEDEDADLQEAMRRSIADAEAQGAAQSTDADMQDSEPSEDTIENAQTETAAPQSDSEPPEEPVSKQTGCYVFIQRFDPFEQCLTGIGSLVAKGEDNIKETVREYVGIPLETEFLVWETNSSFTTKSINTGQSFYDAEISDGTILIIRNFLNTKEITSLEAKGYFPNPQDHLRYLAAKSRQHPVYSKDHTLATLNTFGTSYFSGSIKRGHFHGPGTLISDNCEQYTGPFIRSARSGANGTLINAAGDIYSGSFLQNQRHGEGTYVEKKTGNKYVGGWQQDKRHGKGITYWEVAEDEMNVCQICYGEEQDALFYDCGHVCACTTCARQVEVCPICRANVKGVVRIYRT